MAECVLDASALLAYFNDESGGEVVENALAELGAVSAVNWAEVLTTKARWQLRFSGLPLELEDKTGDITPRAVSACGTPS